MAESRQHIRNILNGEDQRLLLICGPCSIHDPKAGIEYAHKLAKLAEQVKHQIYIVMRVYFEKPRTTVGWKGLIMDPKLDGSDNIPEGLRQARLIPARDHRHRATHRHRTSRPHHTPVYRRPHQLVCHWSPHDRKPDTPANGIRPLDASWI